jgi:hypothetical protein
MRQDQEDRLDDLLDSILDASVEMVQSLICPFCEGALDIHFTSIRSPRRKTGKWLSLHIRCKNCGWKVVADGLPHQPPWVRKLGPKIQTSVAVLDGHQPAKKRTAVQIRGAAKASK